jgi:hypothetical protein
MSKQERVSWVSLIVTLIVGVWYFSYVFALPADANLTGHAMTHLVANLIAISVVLGMLSELVLRLVTLRSCAGISDRTPQDERDTLISLKATRNAYIALFFGIIIVLMQIVLVEWVQRSMHSAPATVLEQILTGPLSALHVAQLLLLAMMLASTTVYISRIYFYRRGY